MTDSVHRTDTPRSVPDVAGRDVGGSQGRPGAAHAHRTEPGYHEVARPLGDVLRDLWARWDRHRNRRG